MPQRQTSSYLMRRFAEVGLQPDKRRGQNFLIDLNLLNILASSCDPSPQDVVLEVGTGLGSLTSIIAPQVAHMITVEIDQHLRQLASEELAEIDNITLLGIDALRNKNNLHPDVLTTVQDKLDAIPNSRFKLVANLPYNIATPVISNLLSTSMTPHSMTVTIQKELADRITAAPSCKDYSALSIWVQSQCDARIVRVMAPSVFWPRPKVYSAIIHIALNEEKRSRIPDRKFFHTFVRSMFFHRRKFLRSVLLSAFKNRLSKPDVDAIMEEQGLGPQTRAETLDVEAMLSLCEAVRGHLE